MESWQEERREVLESVLETLSRGPEPGELEVCALLLSNLAGSSRFLRYPVPEDRQHESRLQAAFAAATSHLNASPI